MQGRIAIAYMMVGVLLAPLTKFINTYIFSDWDFLKFLFVAIAIDTLLGLYKSYLQHNISSKGYGMIIRKIIVYCAALICGNLMVKFTIGGKIEPGFGWIDNAVYSALIVREVISIFENIAIIDPSVFPSSILKRLKDFDTFTGQFKIKNDENNSDDKQQS